MEQSYLIRQPFVDHKTRAKGNNQNRQNNPEVSGAGFQVSLGRSLHVSLHQRERSNQNYRNHRRRYEFGQILVIVDRLNIKHPRRLC